MDTLVFTVSLKGNTSLRFLFGLESSTLHLIRRRVEPCNYCFKREGHLIVTTKDGLVAELPYGSGWPNNQADLGSVWHRRLRKAEFLLKLDV